MQTSRSLLPSRALILCVTAASLLAGCKAKPAQGSSEPATTPAAATPAPSPAPSATDRQVDFVKAFYANYKGDFEAVIKQRPELFDAPLLAALRNDRAIQAKSTDGIAGLDADPFGFGQDPESVTSVKVPGATGDRVHVQTFYQDKTNGEFDMQVHCADRCQLVNVFYPGETRRARLQSARPIEGVASSEIAGRR